ncbi:MAG: FecR domain-containing protein, partial [Bacteroidota bacterium]
NKAMKLRKNKAVLWTAASIVILFGIGAFWFTSQETSSVNKAISHTVDLVIRQTSAGEKKEVHLKDGSIVYLNSGSKLSYSKNFGQDGTRWVKLDGEAFFEVKKDESKPFIIESGNIVTEVKGTSFNIKAFPEANDVAVTVLTGLVGVSKKGEKNKVELIPNRQALFSKEDGLLNVMEVDAQRFSHWKDGILHFEEAQLEDVLIALERWYGVNINTDNLTLENCTLTATFDKSSIYEVMESIKFAKEGVEYTLENNTIEMKGFCNQ